ncbi:hypothetical protein D0Z03_001439 [Geotrichum reessii]|nr:hypothetical protein D0Z03_001439 [Galactomyces reessii]
MRASNKYQQIRKETPRNTLSSNVAQPSRIVRHFTGKRGATAVSDSDEEIDEEEDDQEELNQDEASIGVDKQVEDYSVNVGREEEGKEETEQVTKPKMMIKPITAKIVDKAIEPPVVKAKPVEAPQKSEPKPPIKVAPPPESSSEEEDSSDEEESSSDSDVPVLVRPTFISKAKRGQAAANKPAVAASSKPTTADDVSKRKEATLALAEHSLQHQAELEALIQQTSALDAELAKVDDTDDTDAAAERAAWRLRELERLKRDREALIERERAREELETLREAKTEQEREADALARRHEEAKQKAADRAAADDNESKNSNYMQRYYHKGAFFQEDDFIKNRDFSGAVEDDYRDKRVLPKALQARTSGEVGLRGRSKYRSLAEEDTSRGALWDISGSGSRRSYSSFADRDRDEREGRGLRQKSESAEPWDPEGDEAYQRRRKL